MTPTRAGAGTSQGDNDGDLPPPPPPSANEFFAQFLGNSKQWKKHYASLCRILPVPASKIRGQNPINTIHSRTFWRLSLLSLKRQKNRSRLMSGWTLLNRSSICWGSPKWCRICITSITRAYRYLVDSLFVYLTCWSKCYLGAIQDSL